MSELRTPSGVVADAARAVPAAIAAFDAVAERFDERFGDWASVAAQRRAVQRHLLAAFPPGSHLLELAGGTGEDALFLAARGRRVTLTDGASSMIRTAARKALEAGLDDMVRAERLALEEIDGFAAAHERASFDGAFSNFAGLNCVGDLRPVARALAQLLPEDASALLVFFGPLPPGEVLVQLLRGEASAAFRRWNRHAVPARLGGRSFRVHYPRPREVARAFAPWFVLRRMRGIGIVVPPSAAEPYISRWPRLVRALGRIDRVLEAPFARLGDHVLLHFVRTGTDADAGI